MFAKILTISTLVACIQAGVFELGHQATSYSSINRHEAAPISHYAAPALINTAHVAPIAHLAPVYHQSAPVATYHHAAPIIKAVHQEVYADTHPQYSFQYGVQDSHTGDIKNQHEERDGDVVKGVYSLVQPDGLTRTVHYTSDHHNGFNAQVAYSGKAIVAKTIVPVAKLIAGPVYQAYHH